MGGRELQEQAMCSPTEGSYPHEITVNSACIVLLQAISHLASGVDAEWFLEPAQFVATFGKGNYTAVTDGQLRTNSGKTTSAIVEVKAGPRIGCSGSKKL